MSESPFSPSNHCFRINKTDRSHALNFSSSSASSPVAKTFTARTNTIPKPGLFIPGRDSIKQGLSKQELLWWVKNLALTMKDHLRK